MPEEQESGFLQAVFPPDDTAEPEETQTTVDPRDAYLPDVVGPRIRDALRGGHGIGGTPRRYGMIVALLVGLASVPSWIVLRSGVDEILPAERLASGAVVVQPAAPLPLIVGALPTASYRLPAAAWPETPVPGGRAPTGVPPAPPTVPGAPWGPQGPVTPEDPERGGQPGPGRPVRPSTGGHHGKPHGKPGSPPGRSGGHLKTPKPKPKPRTRPGVPPAVPPSGPIGGPHRVPPTSPDCPPDRAAGRMSAHRAALSRAAAARRAVLRNGTNQTVAPVARAGSRTVAR